MSVENNAALVRRYFDECLNAMRGPSRRTALAILDDLLTPDFSMAYSGDAEPVRGRDRHKAFVKRHAAAFPDDTWTVDALVADEPLVACQWRIVARYAATGNPIDVRAADFFTVRDGRLAELRRFLDFADLDRQIEATGGDGDA